MNTSYLTEPEIEEIKGLKHRRVNYSEMNELKKFLENNGKSLSLKTWENNNNVYDLIYKKHQSTILDSKYYREYREKHPDISSSNWKKYIFENNLDTIDPEGFKIYKISQSLNLEDNRELIERKIKEIGINNFDIESFLLNKDFDFSPYTIKSMDKKPIENLSNTTQRILDFFDDITKNLNEDEKEVYKNNFFQIIDYVLKNTSKTDIKEKNNNFRNLLNFINEKSKK